MSDDPTPIRASNADREAAVIRLREASVEGRLTLEEFLDRMGAAYEARDVAELEALLADLPSTAEAARTPGAWVLGIFGGSDKKGRWRVPARLTVLNIFGGSDLDLRQAVVAGPEAVITVVSIFGGSDITVPAGSDTQVSSIAILGGNDVDVTSPVVPGSPCITIRAWSLFGGTDVRDAERPSWRQRLGPPGPPSPLPPPGL